MSRFGRPFLVALAFLGVAAEVRAQSVRPGGSLVVRDSQGRVVGQLVGLGKVSMVVNGKVVILDAQRDGLRDLGPTLQFDQPNCQGNAFMLGSTVSWYLSTPAAFDPSGVLHLADFGAPAQTQALLSYFQEPQETCTNQSIVASDAMPAAPTSLVKTQFSPPLSVTEGSGSAAAVPATGTVALVVLAAGLATAGILRLVR